MPNRDQFVPAAAPAHCSSCPIRTLTPYGGVHEHEGARLRAMRNRTLQVPASTDFIAVGEDPAEIATLYSGWAYRYIRFTDGARQILSIVLPGEALGLSTLPGGVMRYAVSTLTACTFCCLDKADLRAYLIEDHRACQSVFRDTILHHDRSERQMALLGRRQARQRVAAVLNDLHVRLRRIRMASETEFPFPLRHSHVADLVGLTPIHISRMFRDLEVDRLIRRRHRRIEVLDPPRLARLADSWSDDLYTASA